MTTTFADPTFTLAPLATAPLATADSGPLVPSKPVGSDWSTKRRDADAKVRTERRSAIERARESAEAGWSRPQSMTKSQRLAQPRSKGTRDTNSPAERRATHAIVTKAVEKAAAAHPDVNLNAPDTRAVLETLRQRYPGGSLADIIAEGERWEKEFQDDPVAARNKIIAKYAKLPVENLMPYEAPKRADGLRGSLQRARQDQADMEELAEEIAKYGAGLPKILAQLEAFDRGMFQNAALTSARLAASYGAPSVPEEIPAYQARMQERQNVKAWQQRYNMILQHIVEGIEGGHLPRDEATRLEMAAIFQDPSFEHDPAQLTDSLRRAAAIAQHPKHVWLTGKKQPRGRDPGSLSINGSSPSAGHSAPRGTGGVRASIDRAFAR